VFRFPTPLFCPAKNGLVRFDNYSTMDYYELLKVPRDASEVQIRKAYFNLARQYHPDKNSGETLELFAQIDKAYRVLSDPLSRSQYDNGVIDCSAVNPTQTKKIDIELPLAVRGGFVSVPFALNCQTCTKCSTCRGTGHIFLRVTEGGTTIRRKVPCRCFGGFVGDIDCPRCSMRLRVPAGVSDGATLGVIRDVKFVARVQLPPDCYLDGGQIHCKVRANLADVLFGIDYDGPFGQVFLPYSPSLQHTISDVRYIVTVVYPQDLTELRSRLLG
jgi:hypothetical protein